MGCGGSSGSSGQIKMKKTKLGDMDEFFDDAQGLIDEIYELKDPVEEARDALLESSELEKVTCGNTHHATVGIVFAIASQSNGSDCSNAFKASAEAPYIEINKGSSSGKLLQSIDDLQAYIKALIAAKDRIEPLSKKAKEFAEKAPELPNKAKESVNNAGDLGAMDKISAIKNTATNCKNLGSLPSLVNELRLTVQNSLLEIQGASKELEESKSKLSEIGKKCSEKKLTSPKDCYLECGKEVKVSPEAKKEWERRKKTKKPAGAAKGGAKGGAKNGAKPTKK
jgi:hypothetical protein